MEDDTGLPPAPLLSWSVQLRVALDGSTVLHKLGAGLGKGGVDGADREGDMQALKVGGGGWGVVGEGALKKLGLGTAGLWPTGMEMSRPSGG